MGIFHKWASKFVDIPDDGMLGPKAPRPPTPGLHLPPGAYIPDYRIYKVEDYPEIVKVQKKLAARGIKSDWLRNDCWRYNRKLWGSEAYRVIHFHQLGWRFAAPMLIITALYEFKWKKQDDHGHGHGHDDHGAVAHH